MIKRAQKEIDDNFSDPIKIVEYNPEWPNQFEFEKVRLLNVLSYNVWSIEHIGSTAVPGLGAKPVIDILIGIKDFIYIDKCIEPIEGMGYKYVPEFEVKFPERRFFYKMINDKRTHHIHLVPKHCCFWKRHIAFRDYLRENSEDMTEYLLLKKALAVKFRRHRFKYSHGKTVFIESILEKAFND